MKKLLNYVRKPRFVAIFLTALLAVILPVQLLAAPSVRIEGSLGVANQTAGDTQYARSVNASFDQVVKFQVYYHNMEEATSGKVAKNVTVKATIPNQPGRVQNVNATIGGDNTNVISDNVTVNLNRSDASLNFIPGSVNWRHNKGTNDAPVWVTEKVSDALVTSGQGLNLGDEQPCYNFEATVTFLARVTVPAVSIDKTVRVAGQTEWVTSNTAKQDDTLEYQLAYKNVGNTTQRNVVIRDNLPPTLTYIAGSTYLKNDGNNGVPRQVPDGVTKGGINVGDYAPGGAAYVKFQVKVPKEDKLACGVTEFRNVAVAKPENMGEYFNTAITKVTKVCQPDTPNFEVVKDVRKLGDADWKQDVTVEYGDTVQYRIVVRNTGDTDLKNVVIKDNRPTGVDFVDGTLKVNGQASTQNLFGNGVTIPEIKKGAQAEITFDAKVNKGQTDKCEVKKFRNIASATPEGLEPKEDDANVNTKCDVTPAYACEALDVVDLGNNSYRFSVRVKTEGGATVNKYIYNFGDATEELNTDKSVVEYQYAKPGEYSVVARVLFNIGSEQKEARCTAQVVVPVVPTTPPSDSPVTSIPQTGPVELVAGIFGTSATAYGVMSLVESRRALKKIK